MPGGAVVPSYKTGNFYFDNLELPDESEPLPDDKKLQSEFLKRGEKSRRGYDPRTAIQ